MKRKAYRQNPTVIDLLKKARPPPGEITLVYMNSGPKTVSIRRSLYYTYFQPGISKKEVERVIGEALALYFSQAKGESA